ncbi:MULTISPECIES: thiosulfate oxidation carrier protein SoxY [unclassified Sulfitobacter]|uniref:thiosulfate oxidation carrier protein SoxY n=1 Tax=unclassified Sulfitobacter TaxID=196795 RepID=UPI0007C2F237|nr:MULTISPECIES: thiosulfate oxidation carrier protein SoxY [unclassified Sulfitobacter]KZY03346.1 thiosulfate oxidation carrier protein SoxY [Sulfitobacter sp. HI0023]KZY22754.1 thiosulfate oxidation carrier protein SoxY [Sulfitobacter sp. HI0040]KZZ67746.1 thiosulfate oxidation carrier protein SoxY [Sulfitobacter sp. HI0129]
MTFTRRETLALGLGAAALAAMPGASFASTEEAIAAFTGGAEVGEGGIELTTPEIAENGNTVPVEVSAPGATSIMLLATGNPNPDVGTFNFGPLAGSRSASTRIRLAQSQDVIAIARMEDGSFTRTSAPVKVTIGGCGG